jgi:hypothetical protein
MKKTRRDTSLSSRTSKHPRVFERSWARADLEKPSAFAGGVLRFSKAEVYEVLQAFEPGEPKRSPT